MPSNILSIRKTAATKKTFGQRFVSEIKRNWCLYLMALPVIAYYLVFNYYPMYGAQIAFKQFSPAAGILGSQWIGLNYIHQFFTGPYFWRLLRNTLMINVYELIFSFPAPILLALLLNELRSVAFKRVVQTVIYLPHFISVVVLCSMIRMFVDRYGFITDICVFFGMERTAMLTLPGAFKPIYIISGIWQGVGWGTIIYLSALAGIDQEQYEAATVDGANRFQQLIYITLPGILPTICTLLILRMGSMISVGYEKIILLYNDNILETADVISAYVYRVGLEGGQYGYSTAVGLFTSLVNIVLVLTANRISRAVNNSSLW